MEVQVALARIGNCASALVQGVDYYKNATEGGTVSGFMHVNFAGYRIGREVRSGLRREQDEDGITLETERPNISPELAFSSDCSPLGGREN